MRHGYKGAFEIAATVDYLFAFAATTARAVKSHHFDLVHEAVLGGCPCAEILRGLEPGGIERDRATDAGSDESRLVATAVEHGPRLAGRPGMTLVDRLREILRSDPVTSCALQQARTFDLQDWWIVSGAVYNTVWNHLTGLPSGTGIKDIDLLLLLRSGYILGGRRSGNPVWKTALLIRSAGRDPKPGAGFTCGIVSTSGHPIRPIVDCEDSIRNFASETHAVGVRLTGRDEIEICAPFGLEAMFGMRMVPNPLNLNRKTHEAKSRRAQETWPGLTVEPWPEVTVVRAHAWQDWEGLLALVHRAFAFMEGRIDPPSSLHGLDAKALGKQGERREFASSPMTAAGSPVACSANLRRISSMLASSRSIRSIRARASDAL